jgi:excisionase family DNA binding protein
MNPRNPKLQMLYTTKQVAEMFQVSTETVRKWIDKGQLKAIRVNSFYRIPLENIQALAQQKYGITGPAEETA